NRLVLEFVRLVAELDADSFVFENVKGLTLGPQRAFLDELVEAFARVGYSVHIPLQVLNAASFKVPQNRERLIVLGAKKGIALPSYPKPITAPGATNGKRVLAPAVTCRDALGDLPNADDYDYLFEQDEVFVSKWPKPSDYAAELRMLTDDAW